MEPEDSYQDVVRCHLCDRPGPDMQCYTCDTNLCKDCEQTHLLDKSKEHKCVPFELRRWITKCEKHSSKKCDRYCEQCNIPVCDQCASSREHSDHDTVDVVQKLESKLEVLQRDLQDLKNSIYPKYQGIASDITIQRDYLNKDSVKLKTDIKKHGEDLIGKIQSAIKNMSHEIDTKYLARINKEQDSIKHTISEIEKSIHELNEVLDFNINRIFTYKSRNAEFRKLPPKHTITLPSFMPQKNINFNFLSVSPIKTEEQGYIFPPDKPLIDEPWVVTDINTEYAASNGLRGVSCLSDENVWTCGFNEKIMRLYNLKGELVQTLETKSGYSTRDIAVTTSGELVYTDVYDRAVNISKDTRIRKAVEFSGWKPLNVCCTSSGELLVVLVSDDNTQTKVVRYADSTEKQTIQWDGERPLYSSERFSKYICENRNLDVCVSDYAASAVVVVNHAGNFQFNYTGNTSTPKGGFDPFGITTDSECRILTSDWFNKCIHILDQFGQFLRYINNCDLHLPCGICVGARDNLFVAELNTGKVKKIQYCNTDENKVVLYIRRQ